nr:hypothetical protein [Tanacetum cinerariifolium]
APPSPDYIHGPEEPEQAPSSPDYVSGPEHADDEIVAEDQPYAEDASPTAQPPEYVPESDLEAYPEDDDDKDPEEDPIDYPADGGDDGDDEEGLLAMSSPLASPLSLWSSPPSQIPFPPLPPILSPPSPVLSPAPPPSPIRSLGYRAAMIRLRAEAASTYHFPPLPSPFILSPTRSDAPSSGTTLLLPISVSTSSPPLQLPSASRREDRPEVTLPPWKRLGIALGPRYKVGESSSDAARLAGGLRADYGFVATIDREIIHDLEREVGYEITDSWDEIVETLQGVPVSTDTELGGYMREFETRGRQDTEEIYMRLDDEQSERQLLAGRLNMLFRDRRAHAYTRHLIKIEARLSREAWARSTDASDLVRGEVMSLRTTVLGQMTKIRELHAADHRRQIVISELLRADHRRSTEIIELRTTLQGQGLAGGHTQPELPEEAAPPPSPIRSLGYRAAMIRLRDEAASTSSPPLQLPSASRREDRPEVTLPPQKKLGIALGPRYEVGESSSTAAARPAGGLRADNGFVATMDREIMRDPERDVGYGITDSWDEIVETLQGAPVSTDTELCGYMKEFETRVRQDTDEIYMRLDDEQSERQLLAGRLNMLFRDRRAHTYTRHLMETEARMSREAWVRSKNASDLVCGEVMSLRTTVLGQMTEIRELHAADRRRQTVILELLRTDHRRSTEIIELRTALQGQVTALQGQVTALQAQKQMAPKRTTRSTTDQETINATSVTNAQLQAMIDQGVIAALAARDALRSTNGDDGHNSRTGVRRRERATRECTYTDFLKCQPLPFKGTEGVASLSQWCERMESVFHISNCTVENKVKFATCTLHSVALTWWNTHVQIVGHEAAYG